MSDLAPASTAAVQRVTERLSALPGYACDERTAMVQSLRRTLPWWPVKGKHQDF